ncbi:MAG TPA: restriction endonuclease subunit S, partial [Leptospiraceae bacterium]|nr:restriction endonuclease subunit S [Leptospiraceae bacterium]
LVTCIGATIGKAGLIRRAGACNQQINAIIADDKIAIPEFVYYQIISHDFQIKIKENASSTTLPILNKSKFSSLEFALPSLAVQNAIVDAIESRLSKADLLDKAVEDALQKAEQTKQSILKKAFRGELV